MSAGEDRAPATSWGSFADGGEAGTDTTSPLELGELHTATTHGCQALKKVVI